VSLNNVIDYLWFIYFVQDRTPNHPPNHSPNHKTNMHDLKATSYSSMRMEFLLVVSRCLLSEFVVEYNDPGAVKAPVLFL
jgi:hypothetical protein